MNSAIFEEIFSSWKNNFDGGNGYAYFAKKFGYDTSEGLRSAFRRERKRRGLKREDNLVEQTKTIKKAPKILIFDIENSYIETAVWKLGQQYVGKAQILKDWFCLSYSAKWLNDDEVMSGVLTSKEAKNQDDKRITKELWELLSSCDLAVTYNGNLYDIPKINTRFIINGFPPPLPYKSIDVYQTIARMFSFSSKSMDFVSYKLELERKKENDGLPLWVACSEGNEEALQKMVDYNRQDVICLELDYLRVLPWIKNHPNVSLWNETKERSCGYCGSSNITWSEKLFQTPAGMYRTFRCNDCDGIGRSKENELSKEKRRNISPNI